MKTEEINKPRSARDPQQDSKLLTRKQAAEHLGIAESTLAVWACNRRYDLPYIKLGGRLVRYRKTDLDAFIARGIVGKEAA